MQLIRGGAALAVLTDPAFEVPAVPPASTGIGWLRATVPRFSSGATHTRRRALTAEIINRIPPDALHGPEHPVTLLARAMGVPGPVAGLAGAVGVSESVVGLAGAVGVSESVVGLVGDVAQAYQPGTGDASRADRAVERLVEIVGGAHDELTAARIGILVQACDATVTLAERTRHRPLREVLRDDPPVRVTRRRARAVTTIDGRRVEAGEVVLVELSGELAFGAGAHRCPGEALAVAAAVPSLP
jgi:hypothetical protein